MPLWRTYEICYFYDKDTILYANSFVQFDCLLVS